MSSGAERGAKPCNMESQSNEKSRWTTSRRNFIIAVSCLAVVLLLAAVVIIVLHHHRMLPGQKPSTQWYIERILDNVNRIVGISKACGLSPDFINFEFVAEVLAKLSPKDVEKYLPILEDASKTVVKFVERHESMDIVSLILLLKKYAEKGMVKQS